MITQSNQVKKVVNRQKCLAAFEMFQDTYDIDMCYNVRSKIYDVNIYLNKRFKGIGEICTDANEIKNFMKKLDFRFVNEDTWASQVDDSREQIIMLWFCI